MHICAHMQIHSHKLNKYAYKYFCIHMHVRINIHLLTVVPNNRSTSQFPCLYTHPSTHAAHMDIRTEPTTQFNQLHHALPTHILSILVQSRTQPIFQKVQSHYTRCHYSAYLFTRTYSNSYLSRQTFTAILTLKFTITHSISTQPHCSPY